MEQAAGETRSRVLLGANSFAAVGGVETSVAPWIDELEARGYEVEVVLCRIRGRRADLLEDRGLVVHHHRLYYHVRGFQIPHLPGIIGLARLIRRRGYKVVVGIQPPSHYFLRLAVALSGLVPLPRVVVMEQLSYADRGWGYVALDRLLARRTDRHLCVSESLRKEVLARSGLPSDKVVAEPHGIAVPDGEMVPDGYLAELAAGRLVIGCVARVTDVKRQRLLVEAVRQLGDQVGLRPLVLFVGDDSDDPVFAEEIEAMGMGADVRVLGHRDDIGAIYPLFDVFVLPSVLEGFGLVWAEAMARGIPVITTRIAPMTEFVTDEVNGLLFDADDAAGLAGCLRRLLGDAGLRERLGRAGQEYVRERFDLMRQRGRIVDVMVG
jgi:glycosyltransferase involved in cell wall biosynthesis